MLTHPPCARIFIPPTLSSRHTCNFQILSVLSISKDVNRFYEQSLFMSAQFMGSSPLCLRSNVSPALALRRGCIFGVYNRNILILDFDL